MTGDPAPEVNLTTEKGTQVILIPTPEKGDRVYWNGILLGHFGVVAEMDGVTMVAKTGSDIVIITTVYQWIETEKYWLIDQGWATCIEYIGVDNASVWYRERN